MCYNKNIFKKRSKILWNIYIRLNGVCSQKFVITVDENNIITSVKIIGGCPGNTLAVSCLVEGQKIDDVIRKLKGIKCGVRGTSCPDQLATALEEIKQKQ